MPFKIYTYEDPYKLDKERFDLYTKNIKTNLIIRFLTKG